MMPKLCDLPIIVPLDGRVILDPRQLKDLRQRRALSQEAVADHSTDRRLCLSLASIKRAEAGKPVLYRTARHLAEFYGVAIDALLHVALCADGNLVVERLLFRTILDSVLASGRGHLIDTQGEAGSAKSKLLKDFAADAGERGFDCIFLHARRDWDLLNSLVVPLLHGDRVQHAGPVGAAQIGSLIQGRARQRPVMLSIDGMQCATEMLATMLHVVVPGTLAFPVIWMLASDYPGSAPHSSLAAQLDALPRTVFHLARGSAYARV